LDRVTARITALVNVLRYRGMRDASIVEFASMADAKDGDFVPVENTQQFAGPTGAGGLDRAFWVMPIEQVVAVVRELVIHREQIKQVIYEITGLSDILRGSSQASETATAQSLKSQWGSLRIQDRQAEVQRVARDLIRMKAELVAEKFEPTTLAMMTGVDLPPPEVKAQAVALMQQAQATGQEPPPGVAEAAQSPTWDDVLAVLRSDAMRSYRIDIETDSTIQADATRAQQNAGAFVQGFGGFVQAVGPAVQAGVMPLDVATDLLTAFARTFKLGRQAEDALERLGQAAQQPQAPPDGAGAAEAAAAQAAQAEAAQKAQLEQARMQMDGQVKMAQIQSAENIKRAEIEAEDRREAARLQMQWQIAQLNASIKAAPASPQVSPVALSLGEGAEQAISTAFGPIAQMMQAQMGQAEAITQSAAQMAEAARMMSAPVEIVRGPDGRAVGTRRVMQ
jgi:hypothetical protein